LETTTPHGAIAGKTQTQKVKFYNLDAIIAVGYRVNSYQATQFRIWATLTLKEFIIKGFASIGSVPTFEHETVFSMGLGDWMNQDDVLIWQVRLCRGCGDPGLRFADPGLV